MSDDFVWSAQIVPRSEPNLPLFPLIRESWRCARRFGFWHASRTCLRLLVFGWRGEYFPDIEDTPFSIGNAIKYLYLISIFVLVFSMIVGIVVASTSSVSTSSATRATTLDASVDTRLDDADGCHVHAAK